MVMTSGIMCASLHGTVGKKAVLPTVWPLPAQVLQRPSPCSGRRLSRHRLGLRGGSRVGLRGGARVGRIRFATSRPLLAELAVTASDRVAEMLEALDPVRELVGHLVRLVAVADHVGRDED